MSARVRALVRDRWSCVVCGARNVHDVRYVTDRPELGVRRHEVANMRTLCPDCAVGQAA